MINLVAQRMAWAWALSLLRPSAIICSSNFGIRSSAILFAAKASDLPLEYWPHSRLSKFYKPFLHDDVFLYPEDFSELGRELTTGRCVHLMPDNSSKRGQLRSIESDKILVCLSLLDHPESVLVLDKQLTSRGFEIHYRTHPREKRRDLVPKGRIIVSNPWNEIEGVYFAGVASISSAYFDLQSVIGHSYVVAVNLTGGPSPEVYEGMRPVEPDDLVALISDWSVS